MRLQTWLILTALIAVALAGCIEEPGALDDDKDEVTAEAAEQPVELPAEITGFDAIGTVATAGGGNGLWIDKERAILIQSMGGSGVLIADISDPTAPVELATVDDIYARDADLLVWDNRSIAALAGAGSGIHLLDITDPASPELLTSVELPVGTHNLAVVPGTPYIYNSGAGGIHVADVSNMDAPEVTEIPIPETLNGVAITSDGCHDITVRVDLDRAYCAGGGGKYMQGGGETFIWDISEDPRAPKWLGVIDNPFMVYHHQALASSDGDILMIDDEFIAPNCAHVEAAGTNVFDTPTAAVWFYDISDPADPKELSHIQPPTPLPPAANCGSHFGDLVGDRDVLAMGFYGAGTILVDFSDPSSPELLDVMPPSNEPGSTWDARYHEGHVYTGSNDVQVLRIV